MLCMYSSFYGNKKSDHNVHVECSVCQCYGGVWKARFY